MASPTPTTSTCRICTATIVDNHTFCPYCGEVVNAPRITSARLWQQAIKAFDVDFGIIYTLVALTLHPGQTIKQYLAGDRKRITNPFRYLLIVLAIQSIFIEINNAEYKVGQEDFPYIDHIIAFAQHYPVIFLTPYLLLVSHFLSTFAKHHKFNAAETFIFNIFTLAHATYLYLVVEVFLTIGRSLIWTEPYVPEYSQCLMVLFPLFYVGYGIWAFVSFYRERDIFAFVSYGFVLICSFIVYFVGSILLIFFGAIFVTLIYLVI